MSRQSHLPPRCPFIKKTASRPIQESYNVQHHKSPSQGSILDEQPAWLEDLLSEEDANCKGSFHRRSASDSVTLLDHYVDSLPGLITPNDEDNLIGNETCSRLESASIYGPNSPRKRGNVNFSENAIASALSEYVYQSPLQYVDGSLCLSGITPSDLEVDACGTVGEIDVEPKTVKRHSGQRSRVRKLQYIAELERTVNIFQTMESELAVRVASLLQKRAALSLENSNLKQQMTKMGQEKLMMEGQYKSLKKELERLRNGLADSPNSNRRTYFGSSPPPEALRPEVTWQILDMAKLNLNQ